MGIFKETFPKFVKDQLKIREAIATQHKGRTDSRRVKINGKKMTLPGSAFFNNTVVKQCVIRLYSGVDIDETPNDITRVYTDNLARKFILQGGVPQEGKSTKPRGTNKGGGFSKSKGSTYGDSRIFSDPGDGYGIVPMPGIVDANIRTVSAYGSLREAKINFHCHNRRQLEVLELLYMRPGYPIMVEWGWTPYISNKGKKEDFFPFFDQMFDNGSTITSLNKAIIKRKKARSGNYDAFLGYCKNFEIKARPDGGFECSTTVIAGGEILEGLKSRRDGFGVWEESIDSAGQKTAGYQDVDNFEYIIRAIRDWQEAYSYMNGETVKDRETGEEQTLQKGNYEEWIDSEGEGEQPETTNLGQTFEQRQRLLKFLGKLARKLDPDYNDFLVENPHLSPNVAPNLAGVSSMARMLISEHDGSSVEYYDEEIETIEFNGTTHQVSDRHIYEKAIFKQKSGANWDKMKNILEKIDGVLDKFVIRKGESIGINGENTTTEGAPVVPITLNSANYIESYHQQNWLVTYDNAGNLVPGSLQGGGLVDAFGLGPKGVVTPYRGQQATAESVAQHTYIRWDFLAYLFNEYILPKVQKVNEEGEPALGENIVKISVFDNVKHEYYDYTRFTVDDSLTIIPRISQWRPTEGARDKGEYTADETGDINSTKDKANVMTYEDSDYHIEEGKSVNLTDHMDVCANPDIALFPHQINAVNINSDKGVPEFKDILFGASGKPSKANQNSIGLIFLNADHLLSVYRDMRYDSNGGLRKDFSILAFFKKIWEKDVNQACGTAHDFRVHSDKDDTSTIRILDMVYQSRLQPENLFELKIQGNESIVRDFNFSTTIPTALSATIAVAAQNPDSIDDLDSVTFAALNKRTKARWSEFAYNWKHYYDKRQKLEKELIFKANRLFDYNNALIRGDWKKRIGTKSSTSRQYGTTSSALGLVDRIQQLTYMLWSQYPLSTPGQQSIFTKPKGADNNNTDNIKAGQTRTNFTIPKSSIIPINFNAQIDGIGGIVIGNVFRVDPSRLPKGYSGKDVAFVVLTENQKVSSGQDWVTEISGKLFLLDLYKINSDGSKKDPYDQQGILISHDPTEKLNKKKEDKTYKGTDTRSGATVTFRDSIGVWYDEGLTDNKIYEENLSSNPFRSTSIDITEEYQELVFAQQNFTMFMDEITQKYFNGNEDTYMKNILVYVEKQIRTSVAKGYSAPEGASEEERFLTWYNNQANIEKDKSIGKLIQIEQDYLSKYWDRDVKEQNLTTNVEGDDALGWTTGEVNIETNESIYKDLQNIEGVWYPAEWTTWEMWEGTSNYKTYKDYIGPKENACPQGCQKFPGNFIEHYLLKNLSQLKSENCVDENDIFTCFKTKTLDFNNPSFNIEEYPDLTDEEIKNIAEYISNLNN
jgi:hypothetical protein